MRKITTAEALAAQIQDGPTIFWLLLKRVSCKPDTLAT